MNHSAERWYSGRVDKRISLRASTRQKNKFTSTVVDWLNQPGKLRTFRWRQTTDCYRLLVAELLLRRTNAPSVVPVYDEFIERYPDVERFMHGSEEHIYSIVSKLGLNWRAANVVELRRNFNKMKLPIIPLELDSISKLPGVGPYVARATLVNAIGLRALPVDSNVVRLVCRYFGCTASDNLRRNRAFQDFCDSLLPNRQVREFNYALLDLSATVCTARRPKCNACPLADACQFFLSSKK